MNKLRIFIIIILLLLLLPINIFATGSIKPSTSSLTITKGSSKTFKVTASNACGRVDISSSNSSVAKVNVSSQWLENNSVTVKVTGVSEGNAKITVKLTDAATFDEEPLSGTYTINVTVKKAQPSASNNNEIKELAVEGYDLINAGNNTYELTVNNNISRINITGTAEEAKANISGIGEKELVIGINKFIVTVTAESGAKKEYTINVNRKNGFYLEDFDIMLNDSNSANKNIIIRENDVLTTDILNKIKQSKETVLFNRYNDKNQLIYSWGIVGNLINEVKQLNTNVEFTSEYMEQIKKISNYAEGKFVTLQGVGNTLTGTQIRVFVGDEFEQNNKVNIYYYNQETNTLENLEGDFNIINGYVAFELDNHSNYFITRATIGNNTVDEIVNKGINIYMIIAIVEAIAIVALIVILILKSKSRI